MLSSNITIRRENLIYRNNWIWIAGLLSGLGRSSTLNQKIVPHTASKSKKRRKGEMAKMSAVKCEICNKEAESLFIVSHKKRGRIRICGDCLKQEGPKLLTQKTCSCGC